MHVAVHILSDLRTFYKGTEMNITLLNIDNWNKIKSKNRSTHIWSMNFHQKRYGNSRRNLQQMLLEKVDEIMEEKKMNFDFYLTSYTAT